MFRRISIRGEDNEYQFENYEDNEKPYDVVVYTMGCDCCSQQITNPSIEKLEKELVTYEEQIAKLRRAINKLKNLPEKVETEGVCGC